MGYLHINNLYADQNILLFNECFALEKLFGTSSHISWNFSQKQLNFHTGEISGEEFKNLFNVEELKQKFLEKFPLKNVVIYGETYGGKILGASKLYGQQIKFCAFDVKINDMFVNVPNAEQIVSFFNLEFVHYDKISTNLNTLDEYRDKPSVQSQRNGIGNNITKEGIVLRPLIEVYTNNGKRIIAKHKNAQYSETKTIRSINTNENLNLLKSEIAAEEWVTYNRLLSVLSKMPKPLTRNMTKQVISNMLEDIYRECFGEVSNDALTKKAIAKKVSEDFLNFINNVDTNN